MNSFGERLKEFRTRAGLTQAQFSELINTHMQTVSKWERGISEPDISALGDISRVLGIGLDVLLQTGSDNVVYQDGFDANRFGKALASLRKRKDKNQAAVALDLNVSTDTVSKWERGVVCPDISKLTEVATYYSVSVAELYYGFAGGDEVEPPVVVKRKPKVKRVLFSALAAGVAALVLAIVLPITLTSSSGAPTVNTPVAPPDTTTEPSSIALDYWLNGGMFEVEPRTELFESDGSYDIPTPTKDGADFNGWYTAADYAGDAVTSVTWGDKDISLYAKWSDCIYSVRYVLNGGIMYAQNPEAVSRGEEFVLDDPVRRGYLFLGWFDADKGGTRYISVGGNAARNVRLYARWQKCEDIFNILYEAYGGTVDAVNPSSIGSGEVVQLGGAVKTGYDFVGWCDSADGSGKFYDAIYGIDSYLTLYAIYSPKTVTVVYHLNGGTYEVKDNPNTIVFGSVVDLEPVCMYGHTFDGWASKKDGEPTVTRIDESNILLITDLYACFTKNVYTVRLDADGGSFASPDGELCGEYSYVLSFDDKLTLPDPERAGEVFYGWVDENGKLVDKIDASNIGNVTLTARYRPSDWTYTITFDIDGGTLDCGDALVVKCHQVVKLPTPNRAGHIFLGWKNDEGEFVEYTEKTCEEGFALTAVWQEIRVSGEAGDFAYEKGLASVEITSYIGETGENIDVVVPSYIDRLPVTKLSLYKDGSPKTIRSLTIPNTVRVFGEKAFAYFTVREPVVIPASVESMGKTCFRGIRMSISFEEGINLKVIPQEAFFEADLLGTFVLPEGVERICEKAFLNAIVYDGAFVLPQSLRALEYASLGLFSCVTGENDNNASPTVLFLPDGVQSAENNVFYASGSIVDGCWYRWAVNTAYTYVYTTLTQEQTLAFADDWDFLRGAAKLTRITPATITLVDDDFSCTAQNACLLPKREKAGYTFLGWREEDGDLTDDYYYYVATHGDVTLVAQYAPVTDSDGCDPSRPAIFELGKVYVLEMTRGTKLYFTVNSNERLRIAYEGKTVFWFPSASKLVKIYRYPNGSYCDPLKVVSDVAGQVFEINTIATCKVTIKIEAQ